MMAQFTYQCNGAETKEGGRTIIQAPPTAGLEITNVFVGGSGIMLEADYVNNATGQLSIAGILGRGAWVKAIYKCLPRFIAQIPTPPVTDTMLDHDGLDYDELDYE